MTDTIHTIISKMQVLESLPLVNRVTLTITTSGGGCVSVSDADHNIHEGEFDAIELAAQFLDDLMEYYASGVNI